MVGAKAHSAGPGAAPSASRSLKSMTGYAQARATGHDWTIRISVRSVNHRFLDLHLRLPEGFEALEPRMRQKVREHLRRGHVEVTLRYEPSGPAAIGVNKEVAAGYLHGANSLREQFGIRAEPDLASILRLPGVIGPPAAAVESEMSQLEAMAAQCLDEALEKLDRMREEEAAALRDDMCVRLASVASLGGRVRVLAERARPAFARRLESRLKELLGETALDPARLAQEASLAAERGDVSEELARLASHVRQFESILAASADVGKKLDFLLQEMQREANTLLSKTPGTETEGLQITELGLEIKSEIEKIREQVQNIE
ncbi:MAG: YicC family protein [Acidobacteriota bacterium]|nr:YicC family protein [Acidobacteriota bacterium]